MSSPRIPPGRRSDVGWLNWGIARLVGRVSGTGPPNLFLTLGRRRRLFRGWLRFAGRMMPGGTLARRDTELVILRVAHLRDCRYEFEHHVKLGRKAGLSDADIERVAAGPDVDGWSQKQLAILRAVDEWHVDQDLTDGTWNALREHLDDPRIIELCMLVGHYEMLATFIKTFRIELEDSPARS